MLCFNIKDNEPWDRNVKLLAFPRKKAGLFTIHSTSPVTIRLNISPPSRGGRQSEEHSVLLNGLPTAIALEGCKCPNRGC